MASRRVARIAENQAIFRVVNERVTAWPERRAVPATEKLSFYCECADPHCFDRVYLTAPEYEAIRADSSRFAVVPGTCIRKQRSWKRRTAMTSWRRSSTFAASRSERIPARVRTRSCRRPVRGDPPRHDCVRG
jgi:hypothetical protein